MSGETTNEPIADSHGVFTYVSPSVLQPSELKFPIPNMPTFTFSSSGPLHSGDSEVVTTDTPGTATTDNGCTIEVSRHRIKIKIAKYTLIALGTAVITAITVYFAK